MSNIIDQLFEIATNEEFSAEQRKFLMTLAMEDAQAAVANPLPSPPSLMIDDVLGRHLTKERTPNGIRFGIK